LRQSSYGCALKSPRPDCGANVIRRQALSGQNTLKEPLFSTETWYQRCIVSRVTILPGAFEVAFMDDEPKTAAEMKEIRLNRKLAQDAEGIKAMADIAAADIAIRKRTANLRAIRLAKEAADRLKPAEAKATRKKKKST
jgi:hypothetical protein